MAAIYSGYQPGVIGQITTLHASYYANHWDFGSYFEAKVATELASFVKRFKPEQDLLLTVQVKQKIEGSIIIDGATHQEGVQLRWFILSDALRGKGYGRKLIRQAIEFCQEKEYPTIYLWTFEGLPAARKLYEEAGFKLIKENKGNQWGREVTEQQFRCDL